ncbi:MAG TPA: imidazole glycerol phosphate synthase subunit HisH [Candidatus Acidoferrales bacterium]|nr:imidazole glycerol phosphate synthase subunit HisH [Candidatus Acidoferrales bacterium]
MNGNVAIIDYGLGNLKSVAAAFSYLGAVAAISADVDQLRAADRLVLPGVGAFGDGMNNLRQRNLIEPLNELIRGGKPILGICLGAQLLCKNSEEFGHHKGLGWIDGEVRRINGPESLRVPHVGWNEIEIIASSPLFNTVPDKALFYYCHSYAIHMKGAADCIAICNYGRAFAAAFQRENVFGIQPHPEKSQRAGLSLLEGFLTA